MKRARHLGRRSLSRNDNSHFGRNAAITLSGVRTTCGQGWRAFDCCRDRARQDKCRMISAHGKAYFLCIVLSASIAPTQISYISMLRHINGIQDVLLQQVCCMDTPPGAIWPQTTSPSGLCVSPSKFGNTGVLATKTTQASHRCLEKRHSSRCRSRVELASACTGTRWPPGVQSDPSSSVGCMQDPFTIGCVIGPCT